MNPGSVVPWECFISMQEGTSDASPAVSLPRDLLLPFCPPWVLGWRSRGDLEWGQLRTTPHST